MSTINYYSYFIFCGIWCIFKWQMLYNLLSNQPAFTFGVDPYSSWDFSPTRNLVNNRVSLPIIDTRGQACSRSRWTGREIKTRTPLTKIALIKHYVMPKWLFRTEKINSGNHKTTLTRTLTWFRPYGRWFNCFCMWFWANESACNEVKWSYVAIFYSHKCNRSWSCSYSASIAKLVCNSVHY